MAEYLGRGGRLVIFAEGRLSHTGALMNLFEGVGFLIHKTGARIITCYLRGAHRLPFSPNPQQKKLLPQVAAHFGEALTPPELAKVESAEARKRLTEWVREKMYAQQIETEMRFGRSGMNKHHAIMRTSFA